MGLTSALKVCISTTSDMWANRELRSLVCSHLLARITGPTVLLFPVEDKMTTELTTELDLASPFSIHLHISVLDSTVRSRTFLLS